MDFLGNRESYKHVQNLGSAETLFQMEKKKVQFSLPLS